MVAPDPPAQLVELRQPEAVRPVDDDGIDIRDVDAALDNGGTQQHIALPGHKTGHDLLQLSRRHLTMPDRKPGLRHQISQEIPDFADALDPVVEKEDLTLTLEFPPDGLADQLGLEMGHDGVHRHPIRRSSADGAQIANAGQTQIKGARNRRRGHGQNVHAGPQALQTLLVHHPETLLLVDN